MKKGQSGVSLIALVITIIVVIILAAIAFGTSTRTITNANWSTFTNAVGEVRNAMLTRTTTVKGEEAAKGTTRNDAQVYNYVAKGASGDDNWISRAQSEKLTATRIEPSVIDGDALKLNGRNKIKVNTTKGAGIEVSYYITREGDVFVWPPYEYENHYYVNEDKNVELIGGSGDKATSIKFPSGVTVVIDSANAKHAANSSKAKINDLTNLEGTPTVYWKDGTGAALPEGLETDDLYKDN